jgi:short-subunit dehydrogenase
MKGLEDKYAHITGDSSEVGLEMARELIAESANAAFTDRNKNRLLEAKKRVRWRYINFLMRCV